VSRTSCVTAAARIAFIKRLLEIGKSLAKMPRRVVKPDCRRDVPAACPFTNRFGGQAPFAVQQIRCFHVAFMLRRVILTC
jgi:hypothetical protein